MSPTVGQITLGIYAVLLGVGGVIGYLKAGSRPSLVAGLASGAVALMALGVTAGGSSWGFYLGAALAGVMLAVFAARLARTRKWMPSGLLLAVSLVVLGVLIVVLRDIT